MGGCGKCETPYAPGSPGRSVRGERWKCQSLGCDYSNEPGHSECRGIVGGFMCGVPRGEDIPTYGTAMPAPSPDKKLEAETKKWRCTRCTFLNDPEPARTKAWTPRCSMCGVPRTQSAGTGHTRRR